MVAVLFLFLSLELAHFAYLPDKLEGWGRRTELDDCSRREVTLGWETG